MSDDRMKMGSFMSEEEPCRPNGFGLCMTHATCDHVRHALEGEQGKKAELRLNIAGLNITIEAQQVVIDRLQKQLDDARRERLEAIEHYEGKMGELAGFRDEWERCATETRAVFGKVTSHAGVLLGNLDVLLEDRRVTIPPNLKAVLRNNMKRLTEAIEGAYVETPTGGKGR